MRNRLLLSSAALASMVAETGSGSGSGAAGEPDPIDKADPSPAPLSADQVAPAEPQPDPAPAAVGNAPGEEVDPPTNRKQANRQGKKIVLVWVQPGHETFGIGKVIRVAPDQAEALRSAGRARYASDAEIKAAGDDIADVQGL